MVIHLNIVNNILVLRYRYGSSFRFVGDFLDQKPSDLMGRRKTRIVAIDALDRPRFRQYTVEGLLRYAFFSS